MRRSGEKFVRRYAGIYEQSAWVAECAASRVADMTDLDAVGKAMAGCVDEAPVEEQLELIRAHPELGDSAVPAGGLSADSADEQASAGLYRCKPGEVERFRSLNRQYRKRFGFPFVLAVRGRSAADILDALTTRLENDRATEFANALRQIHRIARLRLRAMEASDDGSGTSV